MCYYTWPNCKLLPTALDPDMSPDEAEEKARLISQVLELQNTLDGELQLSVVYLSLSTEFEGTTNQWSPWWWPVRGLKTGNCGRSSTAFYGRLQS